MKPSTDPKSKVYTNVVKPEELIPLDYKDIKDF